MSEYAKPGDTIEITWGEGHSTLFGKRFKVIETPENASSPPGAAWISPPDGYDCFFRHDNYVLVESGDRVSSSVCQDCQGTGKITLFTSVSMCHCQRAAEV